MLISSREVYRGRHIAVKEELVQEDDNLHHYEIVQHPGAVAILAVDPTDGKIIFEKQYRQSVQEYLYEIPAGTLEKGERPEECAKRELTEETGYLADELNRLISIRTSPGYSNEILHIFFCNISGRVDSKPEKDEEIEVLKLRPDEIADMVRNGMITDSKTLSALFVADMLKLIELEAE